MTKKEEPKEKKSKLLKTLLAKDLSFGPIQKEIQPMSRDEWLAAIMGDIDPMKYAGEGWFGTEEYARPADISDPYVRAQVGAEGEYYPETYRRRKR